MKVLFICNSLEEGRDGVGDQTRRIAIECMANDISPILVAFNDKHISQVQIGNIHDIPVYRLPANLTLQQREAELASIITTNSDIEWVSLQFVCYGLNKRGIVQAEIPVFRRLLKGFKVHIMFHELWVAEERKTLLKMKLLGKVQKWFIISFLKQIKPEIIHTSIPLYKRMLERAGMEAAILPLFSNIERQTSNIEDFEDKILEQIFKNRNNYIICCIFGTIYYDSWDMDSFLSKLEGEYQTSEKKVVVASIGKIAYGKDFWESLPSKYKSIEFLTFGMQEENFISYWLTHFVDLGIVTTPAIITGKSSSMMAFIDHGIPVFCKKNQLSFNFEITEDLIDKRLVQVDDDFQFNLLPRLPSVSLIKNTTQIFIKALNQFK